MNVRLLALSILLIVVGLSIPDLFVVTFLGILLLFPAIFSGLRRGPKSGRLPQPKQAYSQARTSPKPQLSGMSPSVTATETSYSPLTAHSAASSGSLGLALPVLFPDPILPPLNPMQTQKDEPPSKAPTAEAPDEIFQLLLLLGVIKFLGRG